MQAASRPQCWPSDPGAWLSPNSCSGGIPALGQQGDDRSVTDASTCWGAGSPRAHFPSMFPPGLWTIRGDPRPTRAQACRGQTTSHVGPRPLPVLSTKASLSPQKPEVPASRESAQGATTAPLSGRATSQLPEHRLHPCLSPGAAGNLWPSVPPEVALGFGNKKGLCYCWGPSLSPLEAALSKKMNTTRSPRDIIRVKAYLSQPTANFCGEKCHNQ